MHAARVTVVALCVCMYVCPLISADSHIGITKESYQQIHRNTGIVFNFADFPKNALFKCYGTLSSSSILTLFPHKISFNASFEAYSYICFHCTDNWPVEDSVRFVGTDS